MMMKSTTEAQAARRSIVSRWMTDPDFGGVYSFLRPGGEPADRDRLGGEVAPGLVLAGEYTWRASPGTLHGAYFSGERAARIVAAAYDHASAQPVLIIGAGLAGLAAARSLMAEGIAVTVLESSARIGGRAASDSTLGAALPLGGAWLHGNIGHPLSAQVETRPWAWFPLDVIVADQDRVDPARAARVAADLEALESAVDRWCEAPGARDASLAEALRGVRATMPDLSDPVDRSVRDAWLRLSYDNLMSAPQSELSARHRGEPYSLPGGDHQIIGGLDTAIQRLAAGLDVRHAQRVRGLTHDASSGHWCVRLESGEMLTAAHVICAVPLPVLRDASAERGIVIDPPLPAPIAASLQHIGFGAVAKAFFTFDTDFWAPRQCFAITAAQPPLFELFVDVSAIAQQPALCAFATGANAEAVERMSDVDRCCAVDALLRTLHR